MQILHSNRAHSRWVIRDIVEESGLQIHIDARDNTINVSTTGDLDCDEVDNLITALNLAKQLASRTVEIRPEDRFDTAFDGQRSLCD